MNILIINGPNLNMVGVRDVDIYGRQSFDDLLPRLRSVHSDIVLSYFQSNVEGEIIDAMHSACGTVGAIILNAGGYTHTSVAIADAVGAVGAVGVPTVEVHLSNILAREEFRHVSLIAPRCVGSIMGFGMMGYELAIHYLKSR